MKLKRFILSDFTFLIILLLLGTLSIFSYQRINNLHTKTERVNHSNLVKLKLEQTISHIRDAEARQRFFLLTRDSSYLQPYQNGIARNQENLQQLDSLTKDNPTQQLALRKLDSLTQKRLLWLNMVSSSLSKGKQDMQVLLREGKTVMDEISMTVAKMVQLEDELLETRSSEKDYAASITPLYSLVLSVFAIIIFGVAYFILRSETRLRFNAQNDIKKLNDYFEDLPAMFAIVKGPGHVHESANNFYNKITGNRQIINISYREAFPELAGQGFYELLDKVYNTGELFIGKEMPVRIDAGEGKTQTNYFNFIYQPIFNDQKKIDGILIFGYEITEMIEARKKLEEAEQQSRLAIEAANIGTFDWDMENNRFDSSGRLLEIFGFDPAEKSITHQHLIDRFHTADKPIRDKAVMDSYDKGALSYEVRVIWPDMSVHWINVYGKIIYNNLRQALRMYGTAIDITEPKTALEELRESEGKFRLLADSMPQFVWTGDVQGNLDYFNQAVFDYSGLTPGDIEKNGWISIVHPDDREENINRWIDAVINGKEFIFEHRFKNSMGDYRWQLSRAIPQKDHRGQIQRWVGTSTDIHDQKNHSEKLEQQINERTLELSQLNKYLVIKNNIFAQAEENALIGSYSWNLQTRELEYSDNLFRLFGYEPNEFVPSFEKYHSMIHPDDQEQVMKDGRETMETKNLVAHTYRVITKNGTIKHFRSTGKIIDEGGNVMLIGTVQDISQDTLLNEVLRVKNLQLERSNAELESFNYIASHDLQEPLRKIQAFSQRIMQKEGSNFSEFSQEYFSRINSSAARMQNLINALLSYSRADISPDDMVPIDLNIVLQNVNTDLQNLADEKKAVIEFHELPVITAISIQMHQLFTNLVSNAIKYSRPDVAPHINISASIVTGNDINDEAADKKSNYWKIAVVDNGIGFEQEYEHKIFKLFQRLHNSSDYTGTGIGLAICKKIVRNHQGFISAIGNPGTGSTFNVYFPVSSQTYS
ncbi:MAG: PAS domain-containing protein [Ferruginibacter sp.]